jgi:hypothetical protein
MSTSCLPGVILGYILLILIAIIEGILIIEELQNGDYPLKLQEKAGIPVS